MSEHARDLVKRLGVLVGVGQESRKLTDRQSARDCRNRAENSDRGVNHSVYKPRRRVGKSACKLRLKARHKELFVEPVKALAGFVLVRKSLYKLLIADVLVDVGGNLAV